MKVFGIVGWRGVEKTALVQALVDHFAAAGIRVAVIESKPPAESGGAQCADLDASLAELRDVDLVLVDGFKTADHEKLLVVPSHAPHQQENVQLLLTACPNVLALAVPEDCYVETPVPRLPLGDVPQVAAFILDHCQLTALREGIAR